MSRKYDLCIFGASGFTGVRVVAEVSKTLDPKFSYAIAGRSRNKLEAIAANASKEAGQSPAGIVLADVGNEASLGEMAANCRVLLNCVGPYRYYGEPVVRACVDQGTHYVDVTGEPEFIERISLKYSAAARDKQLCIVPSCGFDSIPADIGALWTVDRFGTHMPSSINSFLTVRSERGIHGHYATYESAVQGFGSVADLRALRKAQPRVTVPVVGRRLQKQRPRFSQLVGKYSLPFPGADAAIVRKSQELAVQYGVPGWKPVQYGAYVTCSTFWYWLQTLAVGAVFATLAQVRLGRWLLLKFPKLFTLGHISHAGPSERDLATTSFVMRFFGVGYRSGTEPTTTSAPNWRVTTQVAGPEMGYVATPIFLAQAAYTLLDETPGAVGVVTPAVAFRGTSLVSRLQARGIDFSVVEEGPLDRTQL